MSLVSYIETIAKDGGIDEVEVVNILITEGADVNLADGVRMQCYTSNVDASYERLQSSGIVLHSVPFHACMFSHTQLQEGHALTPLECASLRGFTAIGEVLINAGADVNKHSEVMTVEYWAHHIIIQR